MIALFLGACSGRNNNANDKTVVNVYYIDTKTSGLVSEKYELINTEPEEQVKELLYMLKTTPKNLMYKSALPDKIVSTPSPITDKTLTIDFDSTYNDMTGYTEVLCRAAIVKTLCQIKGVEYIQINVNGTSLISNGDVVGTMKAEDFIDSIESNTNYKIKLYYANKTGNRLIEYDTYINYTGTTSLEELAVEQLINGPTKLGLYNTIPEGTVMLNISKNDGVCTVDFNEKFLDKLPDVDQKVTIYSVVNTLVELPDINKVQFTINSKVVKTIGEDIEFNTLFERNLDLIKETE